jgi:hypothetical protein
MVLTFCISIFGNELTQLSDGQHTAEVRCAVVDGTTGPAPVVQSYFTESEPYPVILTQGLIGEPLRYPLHIFNALFRCRDDLWLTTLSSE